MPVTGETRVRQCTEAGAKIIDDFFLNLAAHDHSPSEVTMEGMFNILQDLWDTAYEAGKAAGG